MEPVLESKTCTHCGSHQPLENFKLRSKAKNNQRLSWCRDCCNTAARQRTAARRNSILSRMMQRIRFDSAPSRIEILVAEASRHAGGIQAFGARLADAIESKNVTTAINAATFVLKLIVAGEQLQIERLDRQSELLRILQSSTAVEE